MRFENKGVLITGGGSGIGRATAINFAKEGGIVEFEVIQEFANLESSQWQQI